MAGLGDKVLLVDLDPATLSISVESVKELLRDNPDVRMVTVTNPGNPTGVSLTPDELDALSEACAATEA